MRTQNLKRQSSNPLPTQAFYDNLHCSQATRVGGMIWLSGQVRIDSAMPPGKGIEEQAPPNLRVKIRAVAVAGCGAA